MTRIEHSVDVHVPVRTAYNQWTQFEEFPRFMDGVKSVDQITDTQMRWRVEFAGKAEEWQAEISEQIPDQRIAWHTVSGPKHSGVVTFHHIDDDMTSIMLQMEYEPDGLMENVGTALGIVQSQIARDMSNFKEFVEKRGEATGAWRGEVSR